MESKQPMHLYTRRSILQYFGLNASGVFKSSLLGLILYLVAHQIRGVEELRTARLIVRRRFMGDGAPKFIHGGKLKCFKIGDKNGHGSHLLAK